MIYLLILLSSGQIVGKFDNLKDCQVRVKYWAGARCEVSHRE